MQSSHIDLGALATDGASENQRLTHHQPVPACLSRPLLLYQLSQAIAAPSTHTHASAFEIDPPLCTIPALIKRDCVRQQKHSQVIARNATAKTSGPVGFAAPCPLSCEKRRHRPMTFGTLLRTPSLHGHFPELSMAPVSTVRTTRPTSELEHSAEKGPGHAPTE